MYSYYRALRHRGRLRAWYAAKVERRNWDEPIYPPPPVMKHPGVTILSGSWADIRPSYIRINRYSRMRGMEIESKKKGRSSQKET